MTASPEQQSQEETRAAADRDLDALYRAFAALRTPSDAAKFLTDLATPGERKAFAERWKIARLLSEEKLSYRAIAEQTGASTTTVARVARFLNSEPHQGYRMMIERMKSKNTPESDVDE